MILPPFPETRNGICCQVIGREPTVKFSRKLSKLDFKQYGFRHRITWPIGPQPKSSKT